MKWKYKYIKHDGGVIRSILKDLTWKGQYVKVKVTFMIRWLKRVQANICTSKVLLRQDWENNSTHVLQNHRGLAAIIFMWTDFSSFSSTIPKFQKKKILQAFLLKHKEKGLERASPIIYLFQNHLRGT